MSLGVKCALFGELVERPDTIGFWVVPIIVDDEESRFVQIDRWKRPWPSSPPSRYHVQISSGLVSPPYQRALSLFKQIADQLIRRPTGENSDSSSCQPQGKGQIRIRLPGCRSRPASIAITVLATTPSLGVALILALLQHPKLMLFWFIMSHAEISSLSGRVKRSTAYAQCRPGSPAR